MVSSPVGGFVIMKAQQSTGFHPLLVNNETLEQSRSVPAQVKWMVVIQQIYLVDWAPCILKLPLSSGGQLQA